ncbi:solute carrier organic anion transporter family member 1A5 [Sigmodon hispidus]
MILTTRLLPCSTTGFLFTIFSLYYLGLCTLLLCEGILETGKMFGPLIGLFLVSFCASIYVDTGSVNTGVSRLKRNHLELDYMLFVEEYLLVAFLSSLQQAFQHPFILCLDRPNLFTLGNSEV